MKASNILKIILMVTVISLSFTSCEKEETIETVELSLEERMNNIYKLNESVLKYDNLSKKKKLNSKSYQKEEQEIINSVVENSKVIFDHLGIKEQELLEVTNENNEVVNTGEIYVAFGLALISSHNSKNSNTSSKTNFMKRGDVGDCLMEATGLNALVALGDAAYALYGGEVAAGWAVDAAAAAAFRKAAFTAAKKIILRSAGGFGAIVMVAQFTNCMLN